MAVAAGIAAVVGMTFVAAAPNAWILAAGILVAGSSTGLASPPPRPSVARLVNHDRQDRANTLINSGTSVGVALSGPVALVAAGQWRLAWAVFAAISFAVLVWNLLVMPPRKPENHRNAGIESRVAHPEGERSSRLAFEWLFGRRSLPLFAASLGLGFASAAYWTFSRELVVRAGDLSQSSSTMFWVILGISGVAGGAAGDLVKRFGLGLALRAALLAMAVLIGMLAAAPSALFVAYPSASLFGATYIMLTGILLVWAVRVFHERPSAGLGAAFRLIAAGQILGSYFAGVLAGATGLQSTFAMFAGLAILSAVFGPETKDSTNA